MKLSLCTRSVARMYTQAKPAFRAPRAVRFVVGTPTWPSTIERPKKTPTLGADYDTSWARKPWARATRQFLLTTVTRPALQIIAKPIVDGTDRLTGVDGPLIFAANHASHLDTSLILVTLPKRFREKTVVAAGADYFFDKRWKAAWWSLAIGAIPVERTKVSRNSAALATELLSGGFNLVIFPEGGRTPDGWMRSFRGGAAFLALRTGLPVVPMFVGGTRSILGKGSKRLRPSKSRVVFGSPMRPDDGEDAREFSVRLQRAVEILADESRTDWWSARKHVAAGTTPSLEGAAVSDWRRAWLLGPRHKSSTASWPEL